MAEMFRDLHKRTTVRSGWGGSGIHLFCPVSAGVNINQIPSIARFVYISDSNNVTISVHCTTKPFTKSLGGHGPRVPPPPGYATALRCAYVLYVGDLLLECELKRQSRHLANVRCLLITSLSAREFADAERRFKRMTLETLKHQEERAKQDAAEGAILPVGPGTSFSSTYRPNMAKVQYSKSVTASHSIIIGAYQQLYFFFDFVVVSYELCC